MGACMFVRVRKQLSFLRCVSNGPDTGLRDASEHALIFSILYSHIHALSLSLSHSHGLTQATGLLSCLILRGTKRSCCTPRRQRHGKASLRTSSGGMPRASRAGSARQLCGRSIQRYPGLYPIKTTGRRGKKGRRKRLVFRCSFRIRRSKSGTYGRCGPSESSAFAHWCSPEGDSDRQRGAQSHADTARCPPKATGTKRRADTDANADCGLCISMLMSVCLCASMLMSVCLCAKSQSAFVHVVLMICRTTLR